MPHNREYFGLHNASRALFLTDNLYAKYLKAGETAPGMKGDHHRGEVTADITATFVVVCAIYFPSVTGMCILCI